MPFVGYPCNAFSYTLHPHYYYFVVDSQADNPADIDEDHGSPVSGEISKEDTVVPTVADEVHEHNEIGEHLLKCPILV